MANNSQGLFSLKIRVPLNLFAMKLEGFSVGAVVGILGIAMVLSSCGQKGPLYLPSAPPSQLAKEGSK